VTESITITDNRTGESLEIPIQNGGVDAAEWRKLLPGIWFHDPGLATTSGAESAITELDGDNGILRYRGYPIEQLAEQSSFLEVTYLLLNGELPSQAELDGFVHEVTYHTFVHEKFRRRMYDAYHYDAHPMGLLMSGVSGLSTFYPDSKDIENADVRMQNAIRLIAKMPTLAASAFRHRMGQPFVYPDNELGYASNFLKMMFEIGSPYEVDPAFKKAMEILLILHADHEQNCSTTAARVVGSSHTDPYTAIGAACGALYGPRHGGANEAVLGMLDDIGSYDNVEPFIEGVKAGKERLMGFGHRVYKNYDPRATVMQATCHEVLDRLGVQDDPLLQIAMALEKVALEDPYFVEKKLYPNVDFYSGIILKAMGFPVDMFTVLFALARTVGWVAQWNEMIQDPHQKIGRPRQLYTGPAQRSFVPLHKR
jgi:citrate synthase